MKQKFIIVNNGLRDYRGHYFETSISLAEAARRAGLHPVLATHVECPANLLPDWLEKYPIFRTDHWMAEPPAPLPDPDVKVDLYQTAHCDIRSVKKGTATVRKLVSERFGAPPTVEFESATNRTRAIERLNRTRHRLLWLCRKSAWAAERGAFYLLPPFLDDGSRRLARHFARMCLPRIMRREYHPRIRNRLAQILRRLQGRSALAPAYPLASLPPEIAESLQHPFEGPLLNTALANLPPDLWQSLEYGLIFKQDLERLLALANAGRNDHVLLGTAHARETPAIQLIAKRLGESRCPHFHLEFRHPLFQSDPTPQEFDQSSNVQMHRSFFSLYEKLGAVNRIRFYTDTEKLSRDHDLLGKLRFGVLPIPFRTELAAPPRRTHDGPLRLVYLGEPRDEKGFPRLPDLIDRLMTKYVLTGKIRFLLQANVSAPQYNPKSAAAFPRLKQYPQQYVELVGHDAPLTPQDYYQLLAESDIVLLPYDRDRYRACSSGTLAEAIASGRPVVVPADSWMSSQLGPGTGETFSDQESLFTAVERVIDGFESYHAKAEAYREHWLSKHTPDHLVAAVTGTSCQELPERIAA